MSNRTTLRCLVRDYKENAYMTALKWYPDNVELLFDLIPYADRDTVVMDTLKCDIFHSELVGIALCLSNQDKDHQEELDYVLQKYPDEKYLIEHLLMISPGELGPYDEEHIFWHYDRAFELLGEDNFITQYFFSMIPSEKVLFERYFNNQRLLNAVYNFWRVMKK